MKENIPAEIGGRTFTRRKIKGIAWAKTATGGRIGIIGVAITRYNYDQVETNNEVYLGSVMVADTTDNNGEYRDALRIMSSPESIKITKEKAQIILDMLQ